MLGHIDQRHRQIARGMQHRKPERAYQDDCAGRRFAALPQLDGPGQQADGQDDGDHRVGQAQLLQVDQAPLPRSHLAPERRVEALALAPDPAECAYDRQVADDVEHLAVDGCGLVGEIMMQGLAGGGETEHGDDDDRGNDHQHGSHGAAYERDEGDCADRSHAGRQHVPDEHVLERKYRVRHRGHPARQHAWEAIAEEVRRVADEVTEQIPPQVAAHGHEGAAGDPAGDPPRQIVGRDQASKKNERKPHCAHRRLRHQRIDQQFHRILGRDRAHDGDQHEARDRDVSPCSIPEIARNEGVWAIGIAAKFVHGTPCPLAALIPEVSGNRL
jgi:hypothetical protein